MALYTIGTVYYLSSIGDWYLPIEWLKNAVTGEVNCENDLLDSTVQ
jgi:hypothetical protein